MIKIHPDQGAVYFYSDGNCYEDDSEYRGVLSWFRINDKLIISKLKADWLTNEDYIEMIKQFKELGVKTVMAHCPTGYVPPGFNLNKYGLYEIRI